MSSIWGLLWLGTLAAAAIEDALHDEMSMRSRCSERHTRPPRILAMRCDEAEGIEEEECDPDFPFRDKSRQTLTSQALTYFSLANLS